MSGSLIEKTGGEIKYPAVGNRVDTNKTRMVRGLKIKIPGGWKPRRYKQNPDGARVEDEESAVKITLFSSVRGGGLRLCRRGF
ncbi:MAG: hypothetical protein EAZ60_12560 [Oscillatoriales cyanobacterium]|nr:MAG: hypothetical protein EAZ83_00750 [Oscillatoriales cyanobacterium]TAE94907.1 MAG: hypothetical protein EAZ79_21275 [Oscillatoriales cyanobacterium]TAF24094.1 MAG: hypothetical protein EAZ73_00565 [Oscillatoriales cyanobacterium]TAF38539.1 MAG: hypothetical protein EAZ69_03775 [Oscillatoriales cyanobacterium]TAF55674.1 MAG: hypothetical protein EAZ60_12560 [Oscillatoriales cyanobacterium]